MQRNLEMDDPELMLCIECTCLYVFVRYIERYFVILSGCMPFGIMGNLKMKMKMKIPNGMEENL